MADSLLGTIGLLAGTVLGVGGIFSFLKGKQLTADATRKASKKSSRESETEAKLRELEQQFSTRETSFRQELEETTRNLKRAEQRAEALSQDLGIQTARAEALEGGAKALEEQRTRWDAERASLVAALEVAQASGASEEELSILKSQLSSVRDQLHTAESRIADGETRATAAEAQLRQSEETADQRLNKLTQMSEKLAFELKTTKDALVVAEAAASTVAQSAPSTSALASSDVFLNALVESSLDAVCVINETGKIITWNRAAEAIYGYGQDEAKSLEADLLVAHDSRASFKSAIDRLEDANKPRTLDIYGVRKDGTPFPIEVVLASWKDEASGERRCVVVSHDVSERRQAEAMRRDKEAAEEANRAKSQFLANMSHELRTPLNAIIGFSEILHDRTFGELTPKQERYVGNILSSGRHLLQLINDILDLSKIEAGRVELDYAAFSPLTAVRTVDNLVKALLQKKNITLEVEGGSSLPPLIADQAKFKQVLYNLISNAIKFTPENGKVSVVLGTAGNGTLLQVDVKDTGIGIKPEDQARIFREFEQVDNSYSRQQQGTGLGLALVKKFIEMHGGRIWVSSEGEGQGSTFSFTVPFGPDDSDKGIRSTAPQASVAPSGPKPMALVVDSDAGAAELLTHHLQEGGYDVARASTGKDALALAQELKPAVLTLEVELSGEDGWEVLQQLKAAPPLKAIPVVVISVTKERDRALQLGASEFVVKPIVAETLLQTLSDVRQSHALRVAAESEPESSSSSTPTRRGRSERATA